jgi:hypothetical protein
MLLVMGCGQQDWTPDNFTGTDVSPTAWHSAEYTNNRVLVLSNNPEIVPSTVAKVLTTLYKCEWVVPEGDVWYGRVFLWHGNDYPGTRTVDIRVSIADANGGVTTHRSIAKVQKKGALYDTGMCCAKAQLMATLDNDSTFYLTAGVEQDLAAYDVGGPIVPGEQVFVGTVHDFAISAPAGSTVRVRTLITPDSSRGTFDDSVTPAVGTHPRGSWQASSILVTLRNSIDVGQSQTGRASFRIAGPGGKDAEKYVRRPLTEDPHAVPASGNKGLYGVNATYSLSIVDSVEGDSKHVTGVLRTELPTDLVKYWGALDGGTVVGVPPIYEKVIKFVDAHVSRDAGLVVNEANATGGGAELPVRLHFEWEP